MTTPEEKPRKDRIVIHYDAVPEDEATQEELNRILRKPGEPGYVPPAMRKPAEPPQPSPME